MTIPKTDHTSGWDLKYRQQADGPAWSEEPQPGVREFVDGLLDRSLVLDVGCGDGRNAAVAVKRGHQTVLLDVSETALGLAMARSSHTEPRVIAVSSIMESLPLASRQFDAVLCLDALPQSANCGRALQEMHRVLKPNGKLYVNVFTPADCAWGEGDRIGPRTFSYKGTLFAFFEPGDLDAMCEGLFEVVGLAHERWTDPPHVPFRPYEHVHDALFYTLRRM